MIQSIHGVKEISYPNEQNLNTVIAALRREKFVVYSIEYVFNKYGEPIRAFVAYGLPVS